MCVLQRPFALYRDDANGRCPEDWEKETAGDLVGIGEFGRTVSEAVVLRVCQSSEDNPRFLPDQRDWYWGSRRRGSL